MSAMIGLDKCLTFINCHMNPPRSPDKGSQESLVRPAITISRQAGAGGHVVAARLLELMQNRAPDGASPWAVFDRNLVEKVLEDHHLPGRLAKFMPEDKISGLSDTIDELFGLHPPSWTLVRKSAETILQLAELGNVILIGRGANVITSRLKNAFHVRLVGSIEKRAKYMQQTANLSPRQALEAVEREDLGRSRFLKKYFGRNIDDPLLYHMVINTDLVSCEEAARLVAEAVAFQPVAA